MGIHTVPVLPGMNDMTLLQIKFRKTGIQLRVPSPFVTIGPDENARMILIGCHLFLQEFVTRRRVIAPMPSAELIEIEDAQRVADVEEMMVGGIMRTHSIHIHLLDEQGILQRLLTRKCASCFRPDAMTVDAFYHQFTVIQIEAVAFAELNGAEADTLLMFMNHFPVGREQTQAQRIEMRMFGIPWADRIPMRFHQLTVCCFQRNRLLVVANGNLQPTTTGKLLRMKPEPQQSIHARIHFHLFNMLTRNGFQPYRTEDASKKPPVSTALCLIHTFIG